MAILPSLIDLILAEETDVESPVSEQLIQKIGSNINALVQTTTTAVTFTTSGTYTKPSGLRMALVFCVGGGGGSGGVLAGIGATPERVVASGGGGGGGLAIRMLKNDQIAVSETVTIGAGGTAGSASVSGSGSANSGGNGGNTSFGSLLIASGGGGSAGIRRNNIAGELSSSFGPGAAAGVGITGQILLRGERGGHSFSIGKGGDSPMGFGSGGQLTSSLTIPSGTPGLIDKLSEEFNYNGVTGSGNGSGAGGAAKYTVFGPSVSQGAAGTGGICLILEIS